MWHTATVLSLGPGWTQVTMFGGCPKWEREKSLDALQKLAKTTVLDFSEQNTHNIIHLQSVAYLYLVLPVMCLIRTNRTCNHFEGEAAIQILASRLEYIMLQVFSIIQCFIAYRITVLCFLPTVSLCSNYAHSKLHDYAITIAVHHIFLS